jgi:phospholipid/cholesterol/gamma-HCH transport system ATP-binding protein
MVTHRYQDGNLIANFRYNSKQGVLEPASHVDGQAARTTFMVMKEGRLIFEGDQDLLEASQDVYISKFVKPRE